MRFELPYPVTTNNLYRNVRGRGRVKTKRYMTWLNAAGWAVRQSLCGRDNAQPYRAPVTLTIQLGRPDKRKRDLSNAIKCIEDLMVEHRVIEDDSLIAKLSIEWADVEGAVVEVTPA